MSWKYVYMYIYIFILTIKKNILYRGSNIIEKVNIPEISKCLSLLYDELLKGLLVGIVLKLGLTRALVNGVELSKI